MTTVFASSESSVKTNAKNIVAIDRKSLSILFEKNCFNPVPMASTTKIMTCIIALENSNLDDIVTISKKASSVRGSTLGLRENQKISMNDLLYGLMLRSGNDCAIAIAEHISGSAKDFSILMNDKASLLSLNHTNFVTPHGLDDVNHYTSAYDLAMLTDYALGNVTFKKIVSTKQTTICIDNNIRTISNTNELLGIVDGVYGVKTGFTFEAGRCLVSACRRNNFDIIVVVLGADTKNLRSQDSKKIINYIFENFEYINIKSALDNAFSDILKDSHSYISLNNTIDYPELLLEIKSNYDYPFIKNELPNLDLKINLVDAFSPSIPQNSTVGSACLYNNDKLIFKTNILLKKSLAKNTWKYYFKKCLYLVF
jgi:D-alanyl-D-alanine carboxypeptidase (penicillin-binding protein 5/6)